MPEQFAWFFTHVNVVLLNASVNSISIKFITKWLKLLLNDCSPNATKKSTAQTPFFHLTIRLMCPSFCWKTHSRRRHHSLLPDACEIFCHASRFFCDIMDPASYLYSLLSYLDRRLSPQGVDLPKPFQKFILVGSATAFACNMILIITSIKLDGCTVWKWNAHNTVLGSKHLPICTCHLTQCRLRWGLPPYQVTFWSIQPFGHNRHRPKFRGCCAPYWEAGFPSNTMWSGPTCTSIVHTKWHVDPSSCLTTIDMGQKVGAAVPWLHVLITQSKSGQS